MAGLAPVLDNAAEASGIVGHDAVDPGSNQGTEVTPVVNRPDNKAQARLPRARGVDRIAPPEFLTRKACHDWTVTVGSPQMAKRVPAL